MQWINKIPIRESRKAGRIEHSSLTNLRSARRRLNLEFEPSSASKRISATVAIDDLAQASLASNR
jgi:hypothetical protein